MHTSLVAFLLAATLFTAHASPFAAITPPAFLPEPSWVTMVDQGVSDPRLKGYLVPQGAKLEIVAENSMITRTADCCFGQDGSLLLLERRPDTNRSIVRQVSNPGL